MSMYGFNRTTLNGGVSGVIAGAALVLAISGFAASPTRTVFSDAAISVVSSTQSDGRLALQAQAQVSNTSTLEANGVRIALGDGHSVSTSNCTAVSFTNQAGAVGFVSVTSVSAIPAVESLSGLAQFVALSDMTAAAAVTRRGACVVSVEVLCSAQPQVTAYPSPINLIGHTDTTADARLALLGASQLSGYSGASATGTCTQWAQAQVVSSASTTAVGRLALLGTTTLSVSSGAVANGATHAQTTTMGEALAEVLSSMTANAIIGTAASDPAARTMTRLFVSKDMSRPFVDRDMRRLV